MSGVAQKIGILREIHVDGAQWRLSHLILCTVVACTGASTSPASAATTIWTGASTGGVFNDDANWSGAAPGNAEPGDLGIFNRDTNVDGTVSFDADATHFRTFVQNTSGTVAFDTGSNQWTMTGFFLTGTAMDEDNHIQLINGAIQSDFVLLGNTSGQTNGDTIEVIGANSLWHTTTAGGGFRIGSGGSDNSQFIVRDGGTITGDGQIIIGLVDSANGLLRVTGNGSAATVAGSIQVGGGNSAQSENNRLEVLDGGRVTGGTLLMGVVDFADNNTTLVSGTGSTLTLNTVGGRSDIGRAGGGHTLQIEDGATVGGGANFVLGVDATSSGNQIVLDGIGTSLTGTGVDARRGSLTVNGGDVTLNDFFDVDGGVFEGGILVANDSAASVVNLNSGSISTVHADIANSSVFAVGDGGGSTANYHMLKTGDGNNGSHRFADGLSLSSNAVLSGSGAIVGNVSGTAGAAVDIGESPGVIHVDGTWDNTDLNVQVEVDDLSTLPAIGGTGYDLLDVNGEFTHGGAVSIDVSGFVEGSGFVTDLKIIGWADQAGSTGDTGVSFSGGPALAHEFRADGLYLTGVSVSVVPEPTALTTLVIGLLACLAKRRQEFVDRIK